MATLALHSYANAMAFLARTAGEPMPATHAYTLDRMRELTKRLDNPQEKYPTILVAGTSGKGSTAAFAANALREMGYSVGLTASPHLQSLTERVQLNGTLISPADFARVLTRQVQPASEEMEKDGFGLPTFFEVLTATAMAHFANEQVDGAVFEVGVGGLRDASNTLNPTVSILTNVSLDHTHILGDTVQQIATDKMGVSRAGHPVVTGATGTALSTIRLEAKRHHARLFEHHKSFHVTRVHSKVDGLKLSYRDEWLTLPDAPVRMQGAHQAANAGTALAAVNQFLHALDQPPLTLKAAKTALAATRLPARFEEMPRREGPVHVYLDGAHNPAKMQALAQTIVDNQLPLPITAVVGLKADKNAGEILQPLLPVIHTLYVTQPAVRLPAGGALHNQTKSQPDGKVLEKPLTKMRFYDAHALALLARSMRPNLEVHVEPVAEKALAQALLSHKDAGIWGSVIVTGSLYLCGQLREAWYTERDIRTQRTCWPRR